ncbi:hypothetical protein MLD38_009362 [Melastoma candidum]|uniref:Uncharacterized protein n=1 Tax=Melastoma candidum TaxID=119954 RepID=A0ACB9RWR3_9MYRT|nr:hypothetical protein MLD38_009362 [Melastoma candidum]
MATPSRIPYPPCESDLCTDRSCCSNGFKYRWPNLVGKSGVLAKRVIEANNPLVTVVVLPFGSVGLTDFCCNRVYVFLDENSNVIATPIIG